MACTTEGDDAPRRGQGTRPAKRVTREAVVVAAEGIAGAGVDKLTMANVAAELDVTPMALYQHVDGKAHLIQLLVQRLLEHIEIPPPSAGEWDSRIRILHRDVTNAMARYPGLVAVERNSVEIPRLLEGYLAILRDAGFKPLDAAKAYTGFYFLAIGAVEPGREFETPVAAPFVSQYPESQAASAAVQQVSARELRDFVVEVYIEGLRALLDRS